MAPDIRPVPINAPIKVVRGIKSKKAVINSAMPVPILPQGSIPKAVNNSTDSGCTVNLKYNVCSKIIAAIIRHSQIKIVLIIIVQFYNNLVTGLSDTRQRKEFHSNYLNFYSKIYVVNFYGVLPYEYLTVNLTVNL